jgi:predicted dehydrogenase
MIKIGIIGTGGMGNWHCVNLKKVPGVKITACCDISGERAKAFAEKHGIPAVYTDYNKMLDAEDLDGITNVTPDSAHKNVALAVLKKGIPLLSEKPLATTLADAKIMAQAAKKAKVINMVNFSYRDSSAVQAASAFIRRGGIGRVMHVEASYLQSWLVSRAWGNWRTDSGWAWRLSTKHGSAGTLGDIGCHIYDLASCLCGPISRINCQLKTFYKGIPGNRLPGGYVLDANDSFTSNVVFKNGALGVIHATRWAVGHNNSLRCRVYGDKGAVEVDLDWAYDKYKVVAGDKAINKAAWKVVKCPKTPTNYWKFIHGIKTGKNDVSDFSNGLAVQKYLHYSQVSSKANKPVNII